MVIVYFFLITRLSSNGANESAKSIKQFYQDIIWYFLLHSRKSEEGINKLYNLLFFFFWPWEFLGQGSNLHHSSDPSHCSDNTASLIHCTHGSTPINFRLKDGKLTIGPSHLIEPPIKSGIAVTKSLWERTRRNKNS